MSFNLCYALQTFNLELGLVNLDQSDSINWLKPLSVISLCCVNCIILFWLYKPIFFDVPLLAFIFLFINLATFTFIYLILKTVLAIESNHCFSNWFENLILMHPKESVCIMLSDMACLKMINLSRAYYYNFWCTKYSTRL